MAKYDIMQREEFFRNYVTDSMYYKGQNMHIGAKYSELLNHKIDNRTGDEIALDVIMKANLKVKDK